MPQARLPDINAAFTKHRNESITSLKSGDYDAVFGALYALNALLPDTVDEDDSNKLKYRVVISDIEFQKLVKHTVYVECYHCKEDSIFDTVIRFELAPDIDIQVLTKIKKEEVWICPECTKINRLARTRELDLISETQLKEPYFLGVMPKPPTRRDGLNDRSKFHQAMVKWSWSMLDELEAKMAQFRDDNWTKNEQMSFGQGEDEDSGEDTI